MRSRVAQIALFSIFTVMLTACGSIDPLAGDNEPDKILDSTENPERNSSTRAIETLEEFEGSRVQMSGGEGFMCAIVDERVRCWGKNQYGQLGQGHADYANGREVVHEMNPVELDGTPLQISAGLAHACVLLKGNRVRCWGNVSQFNLGDPWANPAPLNYSEIHFEKEIKKIASGSRTSCFLFKDGTVKCLGSLLEGDLDYTSIVDIAMSMATLCLANENGSVFCLGSNRNGVAGHATTEQISESDPRSKVPLGLTRPYHRLFSHPSTDTMCAANNQGEAVCWGSNEKGKLGVGHEENIGDNETLEHLTPFPGSIKYLAVGKSNICAIDTSSFANLRCLGNGANAGYDQSDHRVNITAASRMAQGISITKDVIGLATGGTGICVAKSSHIFKCFGYDGLLIGAGCGSGNTSIDSYYKKSPHIDFNRANLTEFDSSWVPTAPTTGALLLRPSGVFEMSLYDSSNRIRYFNPANREYNYGVPYTSLPPLEADLNGPERYVYQNTLNTCTVYDNGTLRCWGDNKYGQLGLGKTYSQLPRLTKSQALALPPIDLGGYVHSATIGGGVGGVWICALVGDGRVRCWGKASNGKLGLGNFSSQDLGDNESILSVPTLKLSGRAVTVKAVMGATCALIEDGSVDCWGGAQSVGFSESPRCIEQMYY